MNEPELSSPAETGHAPTKARDKVGSNDLLGGPGASIKDFIVLDFEFPSPMRVRLDIATSDHWLYRRHKDGHWVTAAKLHPKDVEYLFEHKLGPGLAQLYEAGVPFLSA